jgi:hypothetical protein
LNAEFSLSCFYLSHFQPSLHKVGRKQPRGWLSVRLGAAAAGMPADHRGGFTMPGWPHDIMRQDMP